MPSWFGPAADPEPGGGPQAADPPSQADLGIPGRPARQGSGTPQEVVRKQIGRERKGLREQSCGTFALWDASSIRTRGCAATGLNCYQHRNLKPAEVERHAIPVYSGSTRNLVFTCTAIVLFIILNREPVAGRERGAHRTTGSRGTDQNITRVAVVVMFRWRRADWMLFLPPESGRWNL